MISISAEVIEFESEESELEQTEENQFTCTWCYRTFYTQDLLNVHTSQHLTVTSPRARKLIQNSARFQTTGTPLKQTAASISSDSPKLTTAVSEQSPSPSAGSSTTVTVKSEKKTSTSSQPSAGTSKTVTVKSEKKTSTSSQPKVKPTLSCYICSRKFKDTEELNKHILGHAGKKYPCDFTDCSASYGTRNGLKYHLPKHTSESFTCSVCHALFCQVENRDEHEETHKKDSKKFICRFCGGSSTRNSDRIRHESDFCKLSPYRKVKCNFCTFFAKGTLDVKTSLEVLLEHLHSDHGMKGDHMCDGCHVLFMVSTDLTEHQARKICNRTVTRSRTTDK